MADLKRRPCTVCASSEAKNIATALLAGASVREVASRYGFTKSTIARHQRLHVTPRRTPAEIAAPARLQAIEDHAMEMSVLRAVHDLQVRTLKLLDQAEQASDRPNAARLIGEARRNLELVGRLTGELDGPTAPVSGDIRVTINYIDKAIAVQSPTPPMLTDGD